MHPGKQAAAQAALALVEPGTRLGVGTGSTTNLFIEALASRPGLIEGAVASSEATATRLQAAGIDVLDLNATGPLDLYVDGADEVDPALALIKGGGGALTREKIVAAASARFVCIVDDTKQVQTLGTFPLPIEVIPMARSYVARQLVGLGADPELRSGPPTDNGNVILDCHGLRITDPSTLEQQLNNIAGVVCVGLFALRPADQLIVGHDDGRLTRVPA